MASSRLSLAWRNVRNQDKALRATDGLIQLKVGGPIETTN